MVKGNAPIQMMKKGMGEAAWKEALAVNYPEEKNDGVADPSFVGYVVGGGDQMTLRGV